MPTCIEYFSQNYRCLFTCTANGRMAEILQAEQDYYIANSSFTDDINELGLPDYSTKIVFDKCAGFIFTFQLTSYGDGLPAVVIKAYNPNWQYISFVGYCRVISADPLEFEPVYFQSIAASGTLPNTPPASLTPPAGFVIPFAIPYSCSPNTNQDKCNCGIAARSILESLFAAVQAYHTATNAFPVYLSELVAYGFTWNIPCTCEYVPKVVSYDSSGDYGVVTGIQVFFNPMTAGVLRQYVLGVFIATGNIWSSYIAYNQTNTIEPSITNVYNPPFWIFQLPFVNYNGLDDSDCEAGTPQFEEGCCQECNPCETEVLNISCGGGGQCAQGQGAYAIFHIELAEGGSFVIGDPSSECGDPFYEFASAQDFVDYITGLGMGYSVTDLGGGDYRVCFPNEFVNSVPPPPTFYIILCQTEGSNCSILTNYTLTVGGASCSFGDICNETVAEYTATADVTFDCCEPFIISINSLVPGIDIVSYSLIGNILTVTVSTNYSPENPGGLGFDDIVAYSIGCGNAVTNGIFVGTLVTCP